MKPVFNSALENVIRRVQENREGLKLDGAHQLLAYGDDVNIVRENIGSMKKNTEALLGASNECGLEVKSEKTRYMLMSCNQKLRQKHSTKTAKGFFEDVAKFKYLGTTLTDQNCMHEEIKNRLNSENSCYHSVQSLLSSRLLCRKVKVKIYETTILSVFCIGVKLRL
jgi:hypothetical protein